MVSENVGASNQEHEQEQEEVAPSAEVYFEPVMKLEKLEQVKTMEEDEDPIFKMYKNLI